LHAYVYDARLIICAKKFLYDLQFSQGTAVTDDNGQADRRTTTIP